MTNLETIKNLQAMYGGWMAQEMSIRFLVRDTSWMEIKTPFLDRRGHNIQIYVFLFNEDTFILNDQGYILHDSLGMVIRSLDDEEMTQILNGFGVERKENDSLQVVASIEDFPVKQNNLIQAMLAIDFAARRGGSRDKK